MRWIGVLGVVLLLAACGGGRAASRPGLQRTLDALVSGPHRIAPGAAAYVSGPNGTWTGAAGWADVAQKIRMTPATRGRLGSVSKLWTATVVVKLAEEHKLRLDDSVERWLPGLFPQGDRMTVRQLLNHTSGIVDDNDVAHAPEHSLSLIEDKALRTELLAAAAAGKGFSPLLEVRVAAALPQVGAPGTTYHYSNIGFKAAGLIAEKASGRSLDELYRRVIAGPLDLRSFGYDPTTRPIDGDHATGYVVESKDGGAKPVRDSGSYEASGGIVASAEDEARFLVALVQGKILSRPSLRQLEASTPVAPYALGTGVGSLCRVSILSHGGATNNYMAEVAVGARGGRVAVLLLNGRTNDSTGDPVAEAALQTLFCRA